MRRHKRSGAVLVEFAFMLPVFMTILLAGVDFGRFAYLYIGVTNAARAGAEFGAMRPTPTTGGNLANWQQGVRNAVTAELTNNTGFDASSLVVPTPTVSNPATDPLRLKRVRVEVRHPFRTLVNWPGIPNIVTLRSAIQMRVLR